MRTETTIPEPMLIVSYPDKEVMVNLCFLVPKSAKVRGKYNMKFYFERFAKSNFLTWSPREMHWRDWHVRGAKMTFKASAMLRPTMSHIRSTPEQTKRVDV